MKPFPARQSLILVLAILGSGFVITTLLAAKALAQEALCSPGTNTVVTPPQYCSADKPYEIIPSCAYCGDTLFCYGNAYRLCQTDPRLPEACQPEGPGTWTCPPDRFPNGTILYNGVTFIVPNWVFICDSNVYGCANPACGERGQAPVGPIACTADSSGDQDSRPDSCAACNVTSYLSPGCATPATVSTTVRYERWEPGESVICSATPSQHFVRRDWSGQVILDPSQTTIPFVGAKRYESEENYLTDYFEGTAFYYRRLPADDPAYKEFTGVFRKLAPRVIQDRLREEMVSRAILSPSGAIADAIHNYVVTDGNLRHTLTEFAGHFPPDPVVDLSAYEAWWQTEWGQLWPYVPMFSREDTPGCVQPYLGARINDSFAILNPEAEVEQVPHVARMFELSTKIQHTLLPSTLGVVLEEAINQGLAGLNCGPVAAGTVPSPPSGSGPEPLRESLR